MAAAVGLWAAWAAAAGCMLRILAQAAVGFGTSAAGGRALMFEAGFRLAGTVLPLALVYRWGRVFPRMGAAAGGSSGAPLAGARPGAGISAGLTAYVGVSTVQQLAIETLNGTWKRNAGGLPLWFFWVAMPAYLVWGWVSAPRRPTTGAPPALRAGCAAADRRAPVQVPGTRSIQPPGTGIWTAL